MHSHIFTSTNPATGEILWQGAAANANEIAAAVRLAKEIQPYWEETSLEKRETLLRSFQDTLQQEADSFAEVISKETGKPLWESKAEVAAMIHKVDISITAQKNRCKPIIQEHKGATSYTRYKPLGVAAVFGPFNFPGHLPTGHIIPALLAGNTVVFKPSELTPLVGETLIKIWKKAGLSEGMIALVQGGKETGIALANNEDINALLFTGSWKTGKFLAELMGKRPEILLALEMGGNNPLIVSKITDPKAAAYTILLSSYLTAGQRCTCTRRLILPKGALGDQVCEELLQWISQITIGLYTDHPEPFMGPVISNQATEALLASQSHLIEIGGKPLRIMERRKEKSPFLSPGLIDMTGIKSPPDEELFGPLLQIYRVKNFEEAIDEANNTRYGLIASLLSEDEEEYRYFYKQSKSGLINWNAPSTGASSKAPFGGIGRSGNYRPGAVSATDYCNYPVASLEASSLKLPEVLNPGIKNLI